MTELLPCPFCGGTNVRVDFDYAREYMATWCDDCGAYGPQVDLADALAWRHSKDENRVKAIELWNTRAKVDNA